MKGPAPMHHLFRPFRPFRLFRFLALLCVLCALCGSLPSARADLNPDYAPTQVTVQTSSTALLAADNQLHTVMLTNTGSYAVWVCSAKFAAEVGKGFYLAAGASITFTGDSVPQLGLNAIAATGSCVVAIGRG
jgi:hypothetical protein